MRCRNESFNKLIISGSIPLGILQIEAHTFTTGCLRLTTSVNREREACAAECAELRNADCGMP